MFLLIGWLVASLNYDYVLGQTERSYPRFLEVPVERKKSLLVDLKEAPNLELLDGLAKSGDINTYLLYTRRNPDSPQFLLTDDFTSIQSSNFDPRLPTVILIHGWQGSPSQEFAVSVKEALLQTEDVNVIIVDWRRISSLGYVTAVVGVPRVGKDVAHLLTYLNGTVKVPFTRMHLVGHSLGAHVAANAGKEINGKVRRITGLDPAGPLWYANPYRLKPEDAMYVEAIHTNGLGLGIGKEVADADFFVNGGSIQPGCSTVDCNHARSHKLFVASLKYDLVGRKCSGFLQMTLNLCRGDGMVMGNNDLNKFGKGLLRINTTSIYPYVKN